MSETFRVVSVNLSAKKGTAKQPAGEVAISADGVVGDAHAGGWHRQVSILSAESIERFSAASGRSIRPGEFAENVTIRGIDLAQVALLDRFRVGDVELEVTQIGKECHGEGCAIYREVGKCLMPHEGVFCRVLSTGALRVGDSGQYVPKTLSVRVITLSDRAFAGEYEDKSGPRILAMLADHFAGRHRRLAASLLLIPDDANRLMGELCKARDGAVDVVFTTGGTGLGPRDTAPETVAAFCQRQIPGIMEAIRVKYGASNPNALLSRAVAGASGRMLVYALPGSTRAVEEYMSEILRTLEHAVLMLHGLGHG